MILLDVVSQELNRAFPIKPSHDGVRISTHCIYPTNTFVRVTVRGGEASFYVTDEGGAVKELESCGVELHKPDKILNSVVSQYGLFSEKGVIKSNFIEAKEIAAVVAMVANASKEAAEAIFHSSKLKIQRDIKKLVSEYLSNTFQERLMKSEVVIGKSNKPHTFLNVVRLSEKKRLIVDPVVYQPAAINAHVIANLDVANAQYPNLEQRIIFDDEEKWRAEDLNLLQVGATIVPFSQAPDVIRRLAASVGPL